MFSFEIFSLRQSSLVSDSFSHSRHGQDKTRQSCLVLSCPFRRCESNIRLNWLVLSLSSHWATSFFRQLWQ